MITWPERIFYSLSTVALGAALFILQPSFNHDVTAFQTMAKQQFAIASVQVFGDQPVFDAPLAVIEGVNDFYQQSADATISLLTPVGSEQDQLNSIVLTAYNGLKVALNPNTYTDAAKFAKLNRSQQPAVSGAETTGQYERDLQIPDNFMQGEPVHNIVPDNASTNSAQYNAVIQGSINSSISDQGQADTASLWANLKDGVTGQVYCVAIFNTEVNRYLGPCKNDYK